MADETQDRDFLEYIVQTLVDHPDDVEVTRDVDEMGVLLRLKVHPDDMGQVIGRNGQTARAIRSLVRVVGLKNHARVNLKIEEPEGGRSEASGGSTQEGETSEAASSSEESGDEESSEESGGEDLEDLKI